MLVVSLGGPPAQRELCHPEEGGAVGHVPPERPPSPRRRRLQGQEDRRHLLLGRRLPQGNLILKSLSASLLL